MSLSVHVAEILQICCDSHGAAPAFAGSAEEPVWEMCELLPAGLAERSALSVVLQLICRSLGRGNHSSLPSAGEEGILLLQVNPSADSSFCTFYVPGFCG